MHDAEAFRHKIGNQISLMKCFASTIHKLAFFDKILLSEFNFLLALSHPHDPPVVDVTSFSPSEVFMWILSSIKLTVISWYVKMGDRKNGKSIRIGAEERNQHE